MAGFTNRGKYLMLSWAFRGATRPTNFYLMLFTSAVTPTQDTNVASDLTEIANGNGYSSGGYQLTPGSTDFDVLNEDDSGDVGYLQLKDVTWTASGGNLPASGGGARWACLVTDEATVGNRQVIAYLSLGADRTVSVGQPLTVQNSELRLTE